MSDALHQQHPQTPKELLLPFDKGTTRKISLVPNVSIAILVNNPNRAYALIYSDTVGLVSLLLGEGNAVLGAGLPLSTKGSMLTIKADDLFWTGRVAAISGFAGELVVFEANF